jgi:hypothetical protein
MDPAEGWSLWIEEGPLLKNSCSKPGTHTCGEAVNACGLSVDWRWIVGRETDLPAESVIIISAVPFPRDGIG